MENTERKLIQFSGIKPTGALTLGSYLGAIKNWAERADQFDCYYFMADLHALTTRNDPATLMDRIGQQVYVKLATASGEKNSDMGGMLVCGYAILSDVQITAENRRRGPYDVTLTGCKNLINEVRRLRSSQGHYLKTADGHILAAPHEG